MLLLSPLLIPALGAFLVMCFRNRRSATCGALVLGTVEVAALGTLIWQVHVRGSVQEGRYLRVDSLSSLFLLVITAVFALVLIYASGYLRHMGEGRFSSARWFYALVFLFLLTMISVCVSANLGLLWIMMEGTTLASALLVGFYNTEGAVEAGWKYLIVCTVGIAFALFGTIVLYLAAVRAGMNPLSALDWVSLMDAAPRIGLDPHLVKLAFVFVVVGYGTKIGFVPMHSWLPDAHTEAPTPISALLSAVLLTCAMYAVIRYDVITSRAVGPLFSRSLLLVFGLVSVVVAGLLILVQRNLKRLLAYSSIEHMGIIAIGLGLGGPLGFFGALLHTFNHAIAKSLLFFGAGNVRHNLGTLRMDSIRGLSRSMPQLSAALIIGALAIVGLPPFSLFVSEFAILSEAFGQACYWVAILLLVMLSVIFGGFAFHLLGMLAGEPNKSPENSRLLPSELAPIAFAVMCLFFFGVRVPHGFTVLVQQAMAVLK